MDLALKLIAENKKTQDPFLDLGNCNLDKLPKELFELNHLKVLSLGSEYWDQELDKWVASQNKHTRNNLFDIGGNWKSLSSLKQLFVADVETKDFSPLSQLDKLSSLFLVGTEITDFNPIAELQMLTELFFVISWTKINRKRQSEEKNNQQKGEYKQEHSLDSDEFMEKVQTHYQSRSLDITPLARLNNLIRLDLRGISVKDLTPLAKLTGLEHLSIGDPLLAFYDDFNFLENLKALKSLNLLNTNISDLSPIGELKLLHQLRISSPASRLSLLRDIDPLKKLKSLRVLHIKETKIHDLTPLTHIYSLEEFVIGHMYRDSAIYDLKPLENLTSLRILNIRGTKVKDITPLFQLVNLEKLDLSATEVTDLSPLLNLKKLQEIRLEGGLFETPLNSNEKKISLKGLDSLKGLTSLEILNLRGKGVDDISSLSQMNKLKELNLDSTNVVDITPLSRLVKLEKLNLNNTLVNDLNPLSKLRALRELQFELITLNEKEAAPIRGLNSLNRLTSLEILILCRRKVSDISSLSQMTKLKELDLDSTDVSDITPLSRLANLEKLDLSNTEVTSFPEKLLWSPSLKYLYWDNCKLSGFSLGVNSQDSWWPSFHKENCLTRIRDYYNNIYESGSHVNRSVKLLIVGNGRVGKTSIVRRLLYNKKPEEIPSSTHAIDLIKWDNDLALNNEPLKVQIWDFAGQDIYHSVHRLFMQTKAIYMVVWDMESEMTEKHFWNGKSYENFQLDYWLYYCSFLSKKSPVITVQNKIDLSYGKASWKYVYPLRKHFKNISRVGEVSCLDGRGFDELKVMIQFTASEMPELKEVLPNSYIAVRNRLWNLKEKYITYSKYREICLDEGLDKISDSSADSLINYLHNSGAIFYQSKLFLKQLIIDQDWVISGIYTLFKKEKDDEDNPDELEGRYYELEGRGGLFTRKELNRWWNKMTEDDRETLIEYMISCFICFKFKKGANDNSDDEFAVPQLLPKTKPSTIRQHWETNTQGRYYIRLCLSFYHPAFISRFISQTGWLVYGDRSRLWRNGIWLIEKIGGNEALVESFPKLKEIKIIIGGANPKEFYKSIWHILPSILTDHEEHSIYYTSNIRDVIKQELVSVHYSVDGENWVLKDDLERAQKAGITEIASDKNNSLKISDFYFFLDDDDFDNNKLDIDKLELAKQYVESGDLESALKVLSDYANENSLTISQEDINQLSQLKSRFSGLSAGYNKGMISYQDYKTDRNQITDSVIRLIYRLREGL